MNAVNEGRDSAESGDAISRAVTRRGPVPAISGGVNILHLTLELRYNRG